MFRQLLSAAAVPAAATVAPAGLLLLVAYVLRPQWGRLRPNPLPVRQVVDRLEWERSVARLERELKNHPDLFASRPSPAWTFPTTRERVST